MSTNQTENDIKIWQSEIKRNERFRLITELAQQAGISEEFAQIPPLRVMNWDADKFMINVLAMAKIRDLHALSQKQFVPKPPLGRL